SSITSGGTPAEDVLSVRHQGSEPGQIGIEGITLTYGGEVIGTVSGGHDGVDLTVSLNGNATAEAVQALVRNLTYANNNGEDPATEFRTLKMTLTDGQGGTSDPAILAIRVNSVNDAPQATAGGGSPDYTENAAPVFVDDGLILSDVDNANLARATVSITGGFQSGEDVLAFVNDGSTMGDLTGSYNSETGVLSLSSPGGGVTVAEWQAALRAVTYHNTSDAPSVDARTISFVVSDGPNAS